MGNAAIYEHKTGNRSVNKLMNIGDQYGDKKLCIILENHHK